MSLGSRRSEKRGCLRDRVRRFARNELSLTIAAPVASLRGPLAFRRCIAVGKGRGKALLVSHRTENYLFSQSIPPSYAHFVSGIPSEM